MERIINTGYKEIDYTKKYSQQKIHKPTGLWYSIGTEWIEWCVCEEPDYIMPGLIEIKIDESKLLIIESDDDLTELHKNFNYTIYGDIEYIDWITISKIYSGIEIRNYDVLKYNNSLPINAHSWFLSWDVSSGCIWDLSIIKSFTYKDLISVNETQKPILSCK